MGKETYDDYKRNLHDRQSNSARYLVLASNPSPSPSDDDERSHFLLEGNLPSIRSVLSSIYAGDPVLLEEAYTR
jgi:phospholipid-translocating ATPase